MVGYTEKNPTHRPQLFHVTLPLLIFKHHTSARVEENFRKFTQEVQDINANLQSQVTISLTKIDEPEIIAIFKTLFIPSNSEQQNLEGYNRSSNTLLKRGVEHRL